MTIKQLHYFIAVAETLSFTKAAKRFYVAQTAVSQQIASLERELGLQLFRRNNRHVELTEAGQSFYREIRPLVIRLEHAVQTASAVGKQDLAQFCVGFTPDLPIHLLPPLLRQFHEFYPALRLNLQRDAAEDLARPLSHGDMDAALMLAVPNPPDPRLVAAEPLAGWQQPPFLLAVCPGHPLYGASQTDWDALEGECLILSRDVTATPGFSELEPYVQAVSSKCTVSHSADSTEGILALVAAGLGVALLPAHDFSLVPPHIHLVLPRPGPADQAVTVYYHRNNNRPELAAFLELCRETSSSHAISVEKTGRQ